MRAWRNFADNMGRDNIRWISDYCEESIILEKKHLGILQNQFDTLTYQPLMLVNVVQEAKVEIDLSKKVLTIKKIPVKLRALYLYNVPSSNKGKGVSFVKSLLQTGKFSLNALLYDVNILENIFL